LRVPCRQWQEAEQLDDTLLFEFGSPSG
jgi:hypothetical protein